ncbi:MAG: RHS repeat-associated core domain-containing protein, partial [Acidobacteriota bacterium]
RIITDQNGTVISRKDFTAFGDEVVSPQRVGGTNGNGYDPPNVRQDYTGYQKDNESGLEFAQARYYNTGHGRFTSVDPLTSSATIRNPLTFNRYSYGLNSPYKFTDRNRPFNEANPTSLR